MISKNLTFNILAPLHRFLPESIPWLAANGKEADAEKILRQAGRATGIHFPEVILKRQDDDKPSSSACKD